MRHTAQIIPLFGNRTANPAPPKADLLTPLSIQASTLCVAWTRSQIEHGLEVLAAEGSPLVEPLVNHFADLGKFTMRLRRRDQNLYTRLINNYLMALVHTINDERQAIGRPWGPKSR